MRSGNSFTVMGDLIDGLRFRAGTAAGRSATMGQRLTIPRGSSFFIRIEIHSPSGNSHGDRPRVHHVDLIRGEVTGATTSGTPSYDSTANPTAKVVRRYARPSWVAASGGWRMACVVSNARKDVYFRLRGTNLPPGVAQQTDAQGDPLADHLAGDNTADAAYKDLWFYSNPIYATFARR